MRVSCRGGVRGGPMVSPPTRGGACVGMRTHSASSGASSSTGKHGGGAPSWMRTASNCATSSSEPRVRDVGSSLGSAKRHVGHVVALTNHDAEHEAVPLSSLRHPMEPAEGDEVT